MADILFLRVGFSVNFSVMMIDLELLGWCMANKTLQALGQ